MSQPRAASLAEAAANVVIGYGLAVLVQLLAFPVFGLQPTLAQNLKIGLIFTAVSLLRSYTLRRVFEAQRGDAYRRVVTPAPVTTEGPDRAAHRSGVVGRAAPAGTGDNPSTRRQS